MGDATVVLTSENSGAFYAERLGIKPVEPVAAPTGEPAVESKEGEKPDAEAEKPAGDGSEKQQEQPSSDKAEKGQKVHLRFSELTEQRKAAEAKAAEAEAKATAAAEKAAEADRKLALAEQEARNLRQKYEPPKPDALGPKPKLEQFANAEEFSQALEEWTADRVTREREAKDLEVRVRREWTEREAKARAAIPTYAEDIAAGAELTVSNDVRDAIVESEVGPFMLHHLAKNPEVVSQLRDMSPRAAMRFIGRLEAKFEEAAKAAPASTERKEAPKPAADAEISRAPAPIIPLKGGSTIPDSPVDSKGEFHGTYQEWKAARKAGRV